MNVINFQELPMNKLVDFYNLYSETPVRRFSDRKSAERRCKELLIKVAPASVSSARIAMKDSLKLDRRIRCEETGQEWKNAYAMWKENPGYMSSGQQDRLTLKLYTAAKQGVREIVKVNDLNFSLVNVTAVV